MATSIDPSAALRGRFGTAALFPGDAGYDDARRVWNGIIDRRPAVIVRCASNDDVVAALAYAREQRLPIAVRGGGHNVAGTAAIDDGLVVDLSPMRGVRVDLDRRTATVQGGATWGDVDRATQPHGLAVPGGVVSATGVAGLTLGGGYSHQRRRDGMTIDNLVAAEVVLADGRVVRASEDEHPDLFWALRGGRETLGVVTAFELRMHPIGPEVLSMHVAYPLDAIDVVFDRYRELAAGAPDELATSLLVWTIPPVPGLPEEIVGLPYVGVVGMYAGAVADGEAVVAPYRELAAPIADLTHVGTYLDEQSGLDPLFADGQRYFWKSLYADELSDGAVEVIKRRSLERPSPQTLMIIRHLGGAIGRVPADATAFGERRAQFLVSIDSTWQQPEDDAANIAYTRAFHDELLPYSDGRSYVNFASDGGDAPPPRTRAIKAEYDPDGVFEPPAAAARRSPRRVAVVQDERRDRPVRVEREPEPLVVHETRGTRASGRGPSSTASRSRRRSR